MRNRHTPALWSAFSLAALCFPGEALLAQGQLHPTPSTFSSPVLWVDRPADRPALNESLRRAMGPTSKGLLIGGGIGLAVSALAVIVLTDAIDPGNYSGTAPIIIGGTALGAIIGAAIGAGMEPSIAPRGEDEQRATPVSAPDRNR